MRFINRTNNTVYAQDIDRYFLFLEDEPQEIDEQDILKSLNFQQMVLLGCFEIVSVDKSIRIERNLLRKTKEMAILKQIINSKEEVKETPLPTTNKLEVLMKGHFFEAGGYAKVNRNLAIGLKSLEVDVKIESVGNKNQLTEDEMRKISSMKGKVSKNSIQIHSVVPTFGIVGVGRNPILYTTVESYTVSKQFIEIANGYKEIWVTSDFCKKILEKHGLQRPCFVIPDSVDSSIYYPNGDRYSFKPKLKNFIFVSVFGWSYRKGYDVLLKAYLKEFSGDEDVSLLLVTRYQNETKRSNIIEKTIQEHINCSGNKNPPNIVRCHKIIPEDQMGNLYRACNAFALFSRGEGFSLTHAEASLCGLPVIGTNCSGQTMFLKKDNSFLVDIDYLEKVQPGVMHIHYWDGQEFPALKSEKVINQASKQMRYVFEHYEEARNRNEKLRQFIMSNYSIEKVSLLAKNRLEKLWSRLC